MQLKFKKTYKFAIKTALYLTVFMTLLMGVFLYGFYTVNGWLLLAFAILGYVFSFIVIQFRVEKFIYKRVKKYMTI